MYEQEVTKFVSFVEMAKILSSVSSPLMYPNPILGLIFVFEYCSAYNKYISIFNVL